MLLLSASSDHEPTPRCLDPRGGGNLVASRMVLLRRISNRRSHDLLLTRPRHHAWIHVVADDNCSRARSSYWQRPHQMDANLYISGSESGIETTVLQPKSRAATHLDLATRPRALHPETHASAHALFCRNSRLLPSLFTSLFLRCRLLPPRRCQGREDASAYWPFLAAASQLRQDS